LNPGAVGEMMAKNLVEALPLEGIKMGGGVLKVRGVARSEAKTEFWKA
jgi:hypothetical protein